MFCGDGFRNLSSQTRLKEEKGIFTIFAYDIIDPQKFGILKFDHKKLVLSD
jgi:dTDP-glucose pyrophosphorylase